MRKILKKITINYAIKNNFTKFEEFNILNKVFFKEFNSLNDVHLHYAILNKKKKFSFSKLKMRCFFTGRTHATYKKFMLSRMILKKIGVNGYITGFKKASW